MHTQNTHGWSTLQEGSQHYLYRPVSSMGFTSIESMVQALQDCQNPAIAVPEITRLANGDIYLKEPRGLRSVEDFLKNTPSTRAKLFVVQQLVKLLENLHTFVGVQHGDLHLGCLSIDTDNKLILGGITPSTQDISVDVDSLQSILLNMFSAPSEADVLAQLQSTSLKKIRRGLKSLLAEDTWDDIQSDWSTAVHQTNLEESSEELPVVDSLFDDLEYTMDLPNIDDTPLTELFNAAESFDIDTSIPAPSNLPFNNNTNSSIDEEDEEDVEDWEDVEDQEEDWDDIDLEGWLDDALPEPEYVELSSTIELHSSPEVDVPSFTSTDTITPEMFEDLGDDLEDDWFTDLEATLPLHPQKDFADQEASRQTQSDLDEVSDFEDDEANEIFSFDKPTPEDSEHSEHSEHSVNQTNSADDSWFDTEATERLESLLDNELEMEAHTQELDDFDEFAPEPSEADDLISHPIDIEDSLLEDEDFSTDIFSRSSLFGTSDTPGDRLDFDNIDTIEKSTSASNAVNNTVDNTKPNDHDWFAETTSGTNTTFSKPLPEQDSEANTGGIPKWVLAASAAMIAGGAYAATQQQTLSEPAVFIDEHQVKGQTADPQPTPTVRTVPTEIVDTNTDLEPTITASTETVSTSDTTNEPATLKPSNPLNLDTVKPKTISTKTNVKAESSNSKTAANRLVKDQTRTKQKVNGKVKSTVNQRSKANSAQKNKSGSPFVKTEYPTTDVGSTTVATLPTPKKTALPKNAVDRSDLRKPAPEKSNVNVATPSVAKAKPAKEDVPVVQQTPTVQKSPVTSTVSDPLTGADSLISMVSKTDPKSTQPTPTTTSSSSSSSSSSVTPEKSTAVEPTNETTTVGTKDNTEQNEKKNIQSSPEGSSPPKELTSVNSTPQTTLSKKELAKWSTTAVLGNLSSSEVEALQSIESTETNFTRANAIVLTHGQQSGNVELIEASLSKILSVNANMHKPVFLLAMAQHQFNQQNLDDAREYLMQAEVNWANVERSQLAILRAQRDNIVAHLSYINFMETGSEDSRLQSLTQFRKVQREARRAKLRSLFEQAESKMQMLQRNG